MAFAAFAEKGAGQHRHMGLFQDPHGEVVGREVHTLKPGEQVKGAARCKGRKVPGLGHRLQNEAAAAAKGLDHLLHGVLRPQQRFHRRILGKGRGTGHIVRDHLHDGLDEVLRIQPVAQPPAGHGEGLGETVNEHDGAVVFPVGHHRGEGAVVHQAGVDFVGNHIKAVAVRQFHDGLEPVGLGDRTGGVAGGVQDDGHGAGRDPAGDIVGIRLEPLRFAKHIGNGRAVGQADQRGIAHVAGFGIQHLVAGVHDGKQRVQDGGLGARGHRNLRRIHTHTLTAMLVLGDGFPQFGNALGQHIVGFALLHGPVGGLHNVLGCGKVGLAHLQVDDLHAPGPQSLGFGKQVKGGNPQPTYAFGNPVLHAGYYTGARKTGPSGRPLRKLE